MSKGDVLPFILLALTWSEDKIILCFSPVRPHGYISQGQMGIDVPERRKSPPSAQAVAEETLRTPLLRRSGERMLESK